MRFNWRRVPLAWRITTFAMAWLVLISLLHFWLNVYEGKRQVVTMGYMPVISNLAAPLLDAASKQGDGVRYKALKFSSFAEMAEALRHGEIDAAFIIAPLAIVLHQQGVDVKVIYIGNRHESTLVAKKELAVNNLADLQGHTIAVPLRFSGHNLALRSMLAEEGISGAVDIVEMNPPDMAAALSSGALDAYFVGEPFAAQTLWNGNANLVFRAEEKCPGFICNLLVTRESFIRKNRETVAKMVEGAVRSGSWARNNPHKAAAIAANYWSQAPELIYYALTTPADRIDYDKYIPHVAEMEHMAMQMQRFGLSQSFAVDGLVNDEFARQANNGKVSSLADIL